MYMRQYWKQRKTISKDQKFNIAIIIYYNF